MAVDEMQDPPAAEQPVVPATAGKSGGVWVAIGVVLVIALCLIGAFARNSSTGGSPDSGAKAACRDFVKKRLKAPATADFSGESVAVDGKAFTVTGSVDAENSFGAKLRATYTCVLKDAGDEWQLTSLTGI